jgi:hypothetical protein
MLLCCFLLGSLSASSFLFPSMFCFISDLMSVLRHTGGLSAVPVSSALQLKTDWSSTHLPKHVSWIRSAVNRCSNCLNRYTRAHTVESCHSYWLLNERQPTWPEHARTTAASSCQQPDAAQPIFRPPLTSPASHTQGMRAHLHCPPACRPAGVAIALMPLEHTYFTRSHHYYGTRSHLCCQSNRSVCSDNHNSSRRSQWGSPPGYLHQHHQLPRVA